MKYTIKNYKPQFKQEILTIWEKSVLKTHDFLSKEDFIEIKEFLQNLDFGIFKIFLLVENETVIGFIGLQDKKIEMLFLDPAFIGKGLGKIVLDFAITTHHANMVDVNEQNSNAKKFYEKHGFIVYERTEKDDLGKDYPILKMKLNVKL